MLEYRLQIIDLDKKFSGIHALKGVNFAVKPGEIHAIIGENGAGKSTFMKIINGEIHADNGHIIYNGKKYHNYSTCDAKKMGISMIHQELTSLPNMSIYENIFLGKEICYHKSTFINIKQMILETKQMLNDFNIELDPKTIMSDLTVSQAQMIEIIKAIKSKSELVIMDEPTSSLSDKEAKNLFETIKELKKNNVSIVYISHRLEEIFLLSDNITVLRDGEHIKTIETKNTNNKELMELMVGRRIDNIYPKEAVPIGKPIMEILNLSKKDTFKDISFELNEREILGISGLVGAGRTEIARAIFGLDKFDSGKIIINGKSVKINSPTDAMKNNIAMVSEDRKQFGLVLMRSIKENISLPNMSQIIKRIFINFKKEKKIIDEYVNKLNIKCNNIDIEVTTLSGGNQQKVVLAKWLLSKPKILILDEPTRGIDIGSKLEIYKVMTDLVKQGMSIIIISSELNEIIGMSDRVLVISKGKISNEFTRDEIISGKITQKDLLQSALS